MKSKKEPEPQPIPEPVTRAPGRENARRLSYASPAPAQQVIPTQTGKDPKEFQSLKALSIRQPYAGLIMAGIKNVENRSWFTNYSGPLAIVSTQKPDAAEWWDPMRDRCMRLGVAFPEALCRVNGSILGVVDFNYLVYTDEYGHAQTDHPTLTKDQVAVWWGTDMIGFIFEHPRALVTPIPISGKLGLYNLAFEIVARINEQLK